MGDPKGLWNIDGVLGRSKGALKGKLLNTSMKFEGEFEDQREIWTIKGDSGSSKRVWMFEGDLKEQRGL